MQQLTVKIVHQKLAKNYWKKFKVAEENLSLSIFVNEEGANTMIAATNKSPSYTLLCWIKCQDVRQTTRQ